MKSGNGTIAYKHNHFVITPYLRMAFTLEAPVCTRRMSLAGRNWGKCSILIASKVFPACLARVIPLVARSGKVRRFPGFIVNA